MSAEGPFRSSLVALARAHGVEQGYVDMEGRWQDSSTEALVAVLEALGVSASTAEEVRGARRDRRQQAWRSLAPPVVVAWDGRPVGIALRGPAQEGQVRCHLTREDGSEIEWQVRWADLPERRSARVEGSQYEERRFEVGPFPVGYHRLRLELGTARVEVLILAAPRRAYVSPALEHTWGVFAPLYALHSARSLGVGDFGDFRGLVDWVADLGGRVVGTTPLLASFLDEPYEPSPYSPVTRLFWNELFIDVGAEHARAAPLAVGPAHSLVDYRAAMAIKRRVLESAAVRFFVRDGDPSTDQPSSPSPPPSPARGERGRRAFESFLRSRPEVDDYARFRAVVEAEGRSWPAWPERLQSAKLGPGDFSNGVYRYHQYVQWLAHEQLEALRSEADRRGVVLYFDLPLGAHPGGFDTWKYGGLFAPGMSAGAPPDPGFRTGQDWGFPPLLPEAGRASGHDYFIRSIRHQLEQCGLLRIDHVMSLHRLYWVPEGLGPHDGVYVRYPWEELYAILCLESHRHRAMIVGEDLGLVPTEVRSAMRHHGLLHTYVLQLDVLENAVGDGPRVPRDSVASLNNHDLSPFAGFWRDEAWAEPREELGRRLYDAGYHEAPSGADDEGATKAYQAAVELLACSPARIALMNVEDLWQETERQNLPGTTGGTNWRRKMRHPLEEFRCFEGPLRRVRALRGG